MPKGLYKPITNSVFHYTVLTRVLILWKKLPIVPHSPLHEICKSVKSFIIIFFNRRLSIKNIPVTVVVAHGSITRNLFLIVRC